MINMMEYEFFRDSYKMYLIGGEGGGGGGSGG